MCVIIDVPEGTDPSDKIFERGLSDNQDGWGIMCADANGIWTDCGTIEADFWKSLKLVKESELPYTVHFRMATHGSVSLHNCHPFEILGGDYAVMHNGVISINIRKPDHSDTWHYANDVLAPLLKEYPHAFEDPSFAASLAAHIGSNKLVVLRKDGAKMFINQAKGVEHDGMWLSNSGPLFVPTRGHRVRKSWGKGWANGFDEEDDGSWAGRELTAESINQSDLWDDVQWDKWMEAMDAEADKDNQATAK